MRFSSMHCSRGRRWKSIVIQFSIIVLILNFTWWSMLNLLQDDGGKLVLKVTIIDPYLELASEVREATLDSWNAYKEHAWGLDELRPISQTGRIWMGTALTMVDSLDTLWIMNLRHEFAKARQWITEKLKFDLNDDHINVFEITIRVLGGLLSAYSLSEERVFLEKAETLGSKLQAAFDSQSVLPNVNINLALQVSGPAPWTNDQSLAEVSSLQLELNQLTAVTGSITYALKGGKILKHLHTVKKHRGLLNTEFSTKTGEPREYSRITMGARGDSYYEYLLKVWIQNGKTADFLKQDYIAAIDGIKELLVGYSQPSGFLFVGELNGSKKRIPSMEHLVCFLPGTLAYGVYHGMPADHLQIAEGLMRTCYEMYRQMPKHLSPERVIFSEAPDSKLDIQTTPGSRSNVLRPETMESLFYMYRITRNSTYRDWGKSIFQAFQQHAHLPSGGYASVQDVTSTESKNNDEMNSFWIAETLKYAYLLFNETAASLFPFDRWVFNTEAHPLPIHTTPNRLIQKAYQ